MLQKNILQFSLVVLALAEGQAATPGLRNLQKVTAADGNKAQATCPEPKKYLLPLDDDPRYDFNRGDKRCCASQFGSDKHKYAACDTSSCVENFDSKNLLCHSYGAKNFPLKDGDGLKKGGSNNCPYYEYDRAICDVSYYVDLNKGKNCRNNMDKKEAGKNHCLGKVKCQSTGLLDGEKTNMASIGMDDKTGPSDAKCNPEAEAMGLGAGADCFYMGTSDNWKVCGGAGMSDEEEEKYLKEKGFNKNGDPIGPNKEEAEPEAEPEAEAESASKSASGDGEKSGSGSKSASGDGEKSGSGSKSASGDGEKSGSGSKSASGDGEKSGSGSKSASGDGEKSGSGSKSASGDGEKSGSGSKSASGDGEKSGSGSKSASGDGEKSGSGSKSASGDGEKSGSGSKSASGDGEKKGPKPAFKVKCTKEEKAAGTCEDSDDSPEERFFVEDPPKKPSKGSGSGDPHFKTWTGDKYDYHGECDLVLVDNPTFMDGLGLKIHIRTTRVKYFSYIEKVAVMIGDDVLEFDNDVENFMVNGVVAEANVKHHKTKLGGFIVRRDPKALSIRLHDEGRADHHVAKIDLHTRKNGFPAVIVDGGNTEVFKGSLGLLGDWETGKRFARDGVTELNGEDATDFALEWQVRDTEPMLFKEARFPQFPTTCTPPAERLHGGLGGAAFQKEAEAACAHWQEDMEDCIFDVIATRDVLVAEEGHIVHIQ